MSKGERTYGQWCPIAAGLDVLGDRWVLLICRELAIGDRRFTDLRAALPGLAPNLLTERLRALQNAELVTTAELPPPAARTVYRLTDEGRRVIPVLRAVARFGVQHIEGEPGPDVDATRVANGLFAPWWRRGELVARGRLSIDGEEIDLVVDGARLRIEPPSGEPDVVIATDAASVLRARRDGNGLLTATISGRPGVRKAFLAAFGFKAAT
jgi:DNA-binding HxlR family transcriptional regulator